MRLLLVVSAAAALATIVSAQTFADMQKRPVVASVRIQLLAQIETTTPIKLGAPVVIKLRLKNVTAWDVRVGHSDVALDYEFVVANAAGKEVPRTEVGERMFRDDVNLFRSETLDLGIFEETQETLDLTKYSQLESPGTYYVRAIFRNIFPDTTRGVPPASDIRNQPIEKAFAPALRFTLVR